MRWTGYCFFEGAGEEREKKCESEGEKKVRKKKDIAAALLKQTEKELKKLTTGSAKIVASTVSTRARSSALLSRYT